MRANGVWSGPRSLGKSDTNGAAGWCACGALEGHRDDQATATSVSYQLEPIQVRPRGQPDSRRRRRKTRSNWQLT
jgi:hypothetical protein